MKQFLSALIAVLVVASATPQADPLQELIASRVTANALKAHVSFLASDALQGRRTPSPGLDVAAEYIAAQFRRAGLEPAGDDDYFQIAPYANITANLEGLELTLEIDGNTIQADVSSMGLQQPGAVDLSRVPALKIGLSDADALGALTADDVRGKVLILDVPDAGRGAAAASARNLAATVAKRPALVILSRSTKQGVTDAPLLREVTTQGLVPILVVWDPAVRSALAPAKEVIVTSHIAAPKVVPVKLRNVIGVLRGSDPQLKDTYVMITAHYDHVGVQGTGDGDHIYNGANDDASGTASVIEIATALAALPTRPKRSIVFVALFGEELGLFGSRYYARHPVFPLAKTVADLNLEQLGRTDVDSGTRVGILNVTGFDYTSLTPQLAKAGEEFGVQVVKDESASDAFFNRSDNQAFADAGIPAHTLSVGYEFPDYHKPSDEWPKLDYENMAKVDRTVALAILRVADSSEAPQWNTENPRTERYVKAHESLMAPGAGK